MTTSIKEEEADLAEARELGKVSKAGSVLRASIEEAVSRVLG